MSPDKTFVTLVIGCEPARAERLKKHIKMLDESTVLIVRPERWRSAIRKRKCAAVFVGNELLPAEVDAIVSELKEYDSNVPIRFLKRPRSRQ